MMCKRVMIASLICGALAAGVLISTSAWGDDPDERFGMSEEEYAHFVQQAKQFNMTPVQFKELIDIVLGTPLLYDRKHKIAVAYQGDIHTGVSKITIAADTKGPQTVYVDYDLADEPGRSSLTYHADTDRAAAWRDLNTDGVFDVLLILTDHNDLLKLDRGAYILVEAQWVPAVREGDEDEHRMRRRDNDAVYRFEFPTGRWLAE